MTSEEIIERLAAHETLGSVPRAELEWLAAHGDVRHFPEGTVLTKAGGAIPDGMFILFSGHIVIHVDWGAGPKKVMEWHGGEVTGVLPYSAHDDSSRRHAGARTGGRPAHRARAHP
ncbi:MAG: cyclic nucleotide-binding domain-containing protein [Vicinamibacterales bacterium]